MRISTPLIKNKNKIIPKISKVKASPSKLTNLSPCSLQEKVESEDELPLCFNQHIELAKVKMKKITMDGEVIPPRRIEYTTPRNTCKNLQLSTVINNSSLSPKFNSGVNISTQKLINLKATPVSLSHSKRNIPLKTDVSQNSNVNSCFMKYVSICCNFCDFTSKNADLKFKKEKSDALDALINILGNYDDEIKVKKLSQESIFSLFRMISINIFRPIPVIQKISKNDIIVDTEWPHLQKVYHILNILLRSSEIRATLLQSIVNEHLVISLFACLKSPDLREQDEITNILIIIANRFVHIKKVLRFQCRIFLIKSINNDCYRNALDKFFIFYAEFLQISHPHETRKFFYRLIMPLIKFNEFDIFYYSYANVVELFFYLDGTFVDNFINYLLKHWPITNKQKEKIFLELINDIIIRYRKCINQKTAVLMIKKIAKLFESESDEISIFSLSILKNEEFIQLIHSNIDENLLILYKSALKVHKTHWFSDTRNYASEILKIIERLNPSISQTNAEDEVSNSKSSQKQWIENWNEVLERAQNKINDDSSLHLNFLFQDQLKHEYFNGSL